MGRKASAALGFAAVASGAVALLLGPAPLWTGSAAAQALGKAPACATKPGPFGSPQTYDRTLPVKAIPGVVAGGVSWKKVWQAPGNAADGLIPDRDGNVLMAQEDYDTVLRLHPDGATDVAVANAKGIGAVSVDRQGRLYGAHRTERMGSTKPDKDQIMNAIRILTPSQKVVGQAWAGNAVSERPNDVIADNAGGAYFTGVCLYYASPKGVTTVAEDLNTNGINLSPDNKTLYVTNGPTIVAFDVKGPGQLANRRDFAHLDAGGAGDGMAVDTEGRLYVTSAPGVQVIDRSGKYLGLIPTPRQPFSVTLAGPDRKTLYIVGSGAEDANGQPIRQGPQNTAATVYALPVLAQGIRGHAK